MTVEKLQQIKLLISRVELESAKALGIKESIEKAWVEKYGTSDISEVKKILADMETDLEASLKRKEKLMTELENSYDWDELEHEFR